MCIHHHHPLVCQDSHLLKGLNWQHYATRSTNTGATYSEHLDNTVNYAYAYSVQMCKPSLMNAHDSLASDKSPHIA